MPGFVQEHLRPLAGSAGLHLVLIVLLAGAALRWTATKEPPAVAIEGYVAEGTPAPAPSSRPRNEPQVTRERADELAREQAAAEQFRAEEAERKRIAEVERLAAEAEARRQAEQTEAKRKAAEIEAARVAAEAEGKRRAAEEAKRRQAEEEARKAAEAAEAKRKADADALARREAELAAEREAALQRDLAAEEEAEAFARSGAIDEYRAVLVQAIERNWIRPPSARAGLKCTLYVSQAPGGTVVDVRLGACNGDDVVRDSITNAVYRASPLPAPRDPRAFQRRLEIVFEPRE